MYSITRNFCSHTSRNICIQVWTLALSLCIAILLPPTTISAAQDIAIKEAPLATTEVDLFVPAEYGQVIYRKNPDSPKKIFIIGQSHRSAITGRNTQDIVRVQTEIFRIGEWLIQEKNVGMLLPEGFFQGISPDESFSPSEIVRQNIGLDNQTLEAKLSHSKFVNADMLLNANYNIPLGQVENEQLYRDIRRLLHKANREGNLSVLSRIHGLQSKRTVAMLQNIPDIVEEAFANGRISHPRAMFTIGLGHVGEIIDFLERGTLPPANNSQLSESQRIGQASLKLLEQGYGIAVILPKTLAENEHVLRLARLETN